MRVLHVNNGFCDSKVHQNLTKKLDRLNIEQIVYCPVRDMMYVDKNRVDGEHIQYVYSLVIKKWYRYVYHYKQWKLYKDLKSRVDIGSVNYIHAHTLFSDGGLAYKAYKEYGVKYSVAIRSTDLNGFIRLLKHTYPAGRKILLHADKIFFISKGIMNSFVNTSFARTILNEIKSKFVLVPNGIDDYWHEHITHEKRSGHDVLYIGDFSANKNVVRLAEAILDLRHEKDFEDVRLIIVGGEVHGGGHRNDGKTQAMIDAHPNAIVAMGKIYDKEKLMKVMRSCSMFAMASIYETFGLVYVEALSQNLPVVYTKGQGIDGMFDNTVGIGVNPLSVIEIKNAIKTILQNHDCYGNQHVNFKDFDWAEIADKYCSYYRE